jgi:hypothetical protein
VSWFVCAVVVVGDLGAAFLGGVVIGLTRRDEMLKLRRRLDDADTLDRNVRRVERERWDRVRVTLVQAGRYTQEQTLAASPDELIAMTAVSFRRAAADVARQRDMINTADTIILNRVRKSP